MRASLTNLLRASCPFLLLGAIGCGTGQSASEVAPMRLDKNRKGAAMPLEDPEALALAETKAAIEHGGTPHDVLDRVHGLTRMHMAARDGHAHVLKYLIERGGDVDVPTAEG